MLTVTVHEVSPAPTCSPVTVIVPEPAVAVVAAAAFAQVPPTAFGVATTRPEGSVSTKPTLLTAGLPAGLVTVNVSVVTPPMLIVVGLNDLTTVGTSGMTTTQLSCTPLIRLIGFA